MLQLKRSDKAVEGRQENTITGTSSSRRPSVSSLPRVRQPERGGAFQAFHRAALRGGLAVLRCTHRYKVGTPITSTGFRTELLKYVNSLPAAHSAS